MMAKNPTGLGEPLLSGKRSLFQPPKKSTRPRKKEQQTLNIRQKIKPSKPKVKRIRTTTELTPEALTVIQEVQQRYRLNTGKVLPVWKIISRAIEQHGKSVEKASQG
jgi:hypothetical protein